MTFYLGAKKWKQAVLQDLVYLQRGFDITKAQQKDGDIPVFSSSGLSSWHNEAMAQGPGVIIGRKGTLGSVYYAAGDYWPHDTTLWGKSLNGNHPRFVYYSLMCLGLERFNVGGANPTLNRNHIHGLPIRLADRHVQDKIVAILSTYDDLIENNRRRIGLLEEAARLLYREWFVHFRFPGHEHVKIIDGMPEGWEVGPIMKSYLGLFDGPHATPAPSDEGPVFLGIQNVQAAGGLDLANIRHVSEAEFPKWTRRVMPREGDIVFSYEATLNRYALIPRGLRCCLGRRMALIRPREEYRLFLYLHFHSEDWRRIIAARVLNGATVDRIPLTTFPDFPILLPCQKIVAAFHDKVVAHFKLIESLTEQNQKLAQARDLLLPRLMNGEIAV